MRQDHDETHKRLRERRGTTHAARHIGTCVLFVPKDATSIALPSAPLQPHTCTKINFRSRTHSFVCFHRIACVRAEEN